MTKKLDPAIKCLTAMDKALSLCPSRWWEANIKYLWDAWVIHPKPEATFIIKKEQDVALEDLRRPGTPS